MKSSHRQSSCALRLEVCQQRHTVYPLYPILSLHKNASECVIYSKKGSWLGPSTHSSTTHYVMDDDSPSTVIKCEFLEHGNLTTCGPALVGWTRAFKVGGSRGCEIWIFFIIITFNSQITNISSTYTCDRELHARTPSTPIQNKHKLQTLPTDHDNYFRSPVIPKQQTASL